MSEQKGGWDIVGIGELAKAIPSEAWNQLVSTACQTFERTLAPLTQTTSGLGRWISAKFDTLTESEKINAAATFQRAREKIENCGREPAASVQPKLVIAALAGAALEIDEDMRELWANLLAQEFTAGGVHPQIPQILSSMTPEDARTLVELNSSQGSFAISKIAKAKGRPEVAALFGVASRGPETLSEALLESLGLVRKEEEAWTITALGTAFLAAVQGPSRTK